MYACTVRFPYWNVRNSASLSCLVESGKYFSRNLVLKEVQVTASSRVCIICCMPTHQYSASATNRKVTKDSFYASVHSITLQIFTHSMSHVFASSGVDLLGFVPHKVLHRHWVSGCYHGSRLHCNGLHRIHHPMNRMCNLISPSVSPPSPVCHCLSMPHFQLFTPNSSS